MVKCCVLEDIVSPVATAKSPVAGSLTALKGAPALEAGPREVAPGVFFLKGGTRYFQEGTLSGPAGAVRSLMCNNGWVILDDSVLLERTCDQLLAAPIN